MKAMRRKKKILRLKQTRNLVAINKRIASFTTWEPGDCIYCDDALPKGEDEFCNKLCRKDYIEENGDGTEEETCEECGESPDYCSCDPW